MAAALSPQQVDIQILLAFMEFLVQNGQSQPTNLKYMAALRAYHIMHNLSTDPVKDGRIQLFQKSLKIHAPFRPMQRNLLTIDLLSKIIQQCQTLPFSFIFSPLYLLAYFSFLRMSNILLHSTTSFDKTRQLAHVDVIIQPQGAVVLVKWSKTIQNRPLQCLWFLNIEVMP